MSLYVPTYLSCVWNSVSRQGYFGETRFIGRVKQSYHNVSIRAVLYCNGCHCRRKGHIGLFDSCNIFNFAFAYLFLVSYISSQFF